MNLNIFQANIKEDFEFRIAKKKPEKLKLPPDFLKKKIYNMFSFYFGLIFLPLKFNYLILFCDEIFKNALQFWRKNSKCPKVKFCQN